MKNKIIALLLEKAKARFPGREIYPCGNKQSFNDCLQSFYSEKRKYTLHTFYYNVQGDKSSKAESLKLDKNNSTL